MLGMDRNTAMYNIHTALEAQGIDVANPSMRLWTSEGEALDAVRSAFRPHVGTERSHTRKKKIGGNSEVDPVGPELLGVTPHLFDLGVCHVGARIYHYEDGVTITAYVA